MADVTVWLVALLRWSPFESEPDGNRWYPHHALWATLVLAVGWYLWTPSGHPALGAGLVLLAAYLILDDWVSHALGWPTPADWAFRRLLRFPWFLRPWRWVYRRVYR